MENHEHLPYYSDPIPVCYALDEVMELLDSFPEFKICLYVASKSETDWESNSKRAYINKVIPRLLYIPVSISPSNLDQLRALCTYVIDVDRILALDLSTEFSGNEAIEEVFSQYTTLPSMYDLIIRSGDSFVAKSLDGKNSLEHDYSVFKEIASVMGYSLMSFEEFSQVIVA